MALEGRRCTPAFIGLCRRQSSPAELTSQAATVLRTRQIGERGPGLDVSTARIRLRDMSYIDNQHSAHDDLVYENRNNPWPERPSPPTPQKKTNDLSEAGQCRAGDGRTSLS